MPQTLTNKNSWLKSGPKPTTEDFNQHPPLQRGYYSTESLLVSKGVQGHGYEGHF